jgi:hypothetical protein
MKANRFDIAYGYETNANHFSNTIIVVLTCQTRCLTTNTQWNNMLNESIGAENTEFLEECSMASSLPSVQ